MFYIYVNLKKIIFFYFNKIIRKNICLCFCDGSLYDFSFLWYYFIIYYFVLIF